MAVPPAHLRGIDSVLAERCMVRATLWNSIESECSGNSWEYYLFGSTTTFRAGWKHLCPSKSRASTTAARCSGPSTCWVLVRRWCVLRTNCWYLSCLWWQGRCSTWAVTDRCLCVSSMPTPESACRIESKVVESLKKQSKFKESRAFKRGVCYVL